jgi:hypothetical protein
MVIVKIYKKFVDLIKKLFIFFFISFIFIYKALINFDIFVIFKWPFIFFLNLYEFKLLRKKRKKKLKYLIKNYDKYYKILLNYNKLPKLKSKYFLINYFKLKIKFYIIQAFFILVNFYKLNFELIKNSKKKRKFFGIFNFDFFSNLNLHFISRKKSIKTNFIVLYINFLKKNYLNSFYIRYRISWFQNRIRDQRSLFWDRIEYKKEKLEEFFLNPYFFFVSNILHISSYMPFNFINLLIFVLTWISYWFIEYLYEILQILLLKYENLKEKFNKKKKDLKNTVLNLFLKVLFPFFIINI